MKSTQAIAVSTLLCTASAWKYEATSGFGISPVPGTPQESLFETANEHPNATKSGKFKINNEMWTFTVKVTELTPSGADTNISDPRVINTLYQISWPDGSSSLNETLRDLQDLRPDQQPRFCGSYFYGLAPASVTNDYEEDDDGDCSGALGDDCTQGLAGQEVPRDGFPCLAVDVPDSCTDKLPRQGGAVGYGSLNARNGSTSSPFEFAFWSSPIYEAGNTTYFERETERLHIWVFGSIANSPVCLRIQDDNVDKGSPATAAATSLWTNWIWYGIAGTMAGVAFLV